MCVFNDQFFGMELTEVTGPKLKMKNKIDQVDQWNLFNNYYYQNYLNSGSYLTLSMICPYIDYGCTKIQQLNPIRKKI